MIKRFLYTLCIFSLVSTSCKKKESPTFEAKEERNISYGKEALQKMDILFPEGYNEQTPVVFLIHGGGFFAGTKEEFETQAQKFRANGFIIVNLSHRLINADGLLELPPKRLNSDIKIKNELEDVQTAVNTFKSMAPEQHAGTSRMYMAGHSAGAILSMLYVQGDWNADKHIRASGNWAGLTDLSIPAEVSEKLDPRWIELFHRATGAAPTPENALYFMAVSPFWVTYSKKGMPNISIFPENNIVFNVEGEKEYQYKNTVNYHHLLEERGIPEKLIYYKGEDHGFGTIPGSWDKLIKETADFFNQH